MLNLTIGHEYLTNEKKKILARTKNFLMIVIVTKKKYRDAIFACVCVHCSIFCVSKKQEGPACRGIRSPETELTSFLAREGVFPIGAEVNQRNENQRSKIINNLLTINHHCAHFTSIVKQNNFGK